MNEGRKGYFDQEQVLVIPLRLPVLQGVSLDNREEAQKHREGEWEGVRDWALAERCSRKTEVLQRSAFVLIWVSFQVGQVWEHMGRICLFSGTFWFHVLSSSLLKSSASSVESPRVRERRGLSARRSLTWQHTPPSGALPPRPHPLLKKKLSLSGNAYLLHRDFSG